MVGYAGDGTSMGRLHDDTQVSNVGERQSVIYPGNEVSHVKGCWVCTWHLQPYFLSSASVTNGYQFLFRGTLNLAQAFKNSLLESHVQSLDAQMLQSEAF